MPNFSAVWVWIRVRYFDPEYWIYLWDQLILLQYEVLEKLVTYIDRVSYVYIDRVWLKHLYKTPDKLPYKWKGAHFCHSHIAHRIGEIHNYFGCLQFFLLLLGTRFSWLVLLMWFCQILMADFPLTSWLCSVFISHKKQNFSCLVLLLGGCETQFKDLQCALQKCENV